MSVGTGSILGTFRLLARLFPATPLEHLTALSLAELKTTYRRRDRWYNVIGFTAFAGCAVA